MSKKRTGSEYKDKNSVWWAKVNYTDAQGRRRAVKRRARNKTDAIEKKYALLKLVAGGERAIDGARMTFAELAAEYARKHLIKAVYSGEMRVAGLADPKSPARRLGVWTALIGRARVRDITHSDLKAWKLLRTQTPAAKSWIEAGETKSKISGARSIVTVNREMQILRAVFRFAVREGYIERSPFERGESLISIAQEQARERVLSRAEEEALLGECIAPHRAHLRPLVVCAIETAMRKGELLKLVRGDVDFERMQIAVRARNSKTNKRRIIPVSGRLASELRALFERLPSGEDVSVFGVTSDIKRSFSTARRAAQVSDLRFHDLRHTAITRMIVAAARAHRSPFEVMKIVGHTQIKTFMRYINMYDELIAGMGAAMDDLQREHDARKVIEVLGEKVN